METDSKGQLGGLDTNEAERKRYAERSVSWKCASCGKANEEILKECADAAKEMEAANGEGSSKVEETVPPELKIGFKPDNTEAGPQSAAHPATASETPIQRQSEAYPPARPAQGVPQPTATPASDSSEPQRAEITPRPQDIPAATPTATLQAVRTHQVHVSNDGDLVWIDRAIAGIVICLVFMVTKVYLGL